MNELRKAAEMALEALQANYLLVNGDALSAGLERCLEGYYSDSFDIESVNKQTDEAITSLRQALEQPEQTVSLEEYKRLQRLVTSQGIRLMEYESKQEPVAWVNADNLQGLTLGYFGCAEIYTNETQGRIPLYTAPPASKPWVGLTDAEIGIVSADIWGSVLIAPQSYQAFARAIEAKLKEKNT